MHMADALLSPAVGATMWGVSTGAIGWSSRRLRLEQDESRVPLMGVMGAFLFAAQMINFAIPATGSSGHLGGGLLLAILLGPSAAFLTIASVLVVQALFFADGGLLALGCNIFNMGFIPAFVAYPLVYRRIAGPDPGRTRLAAAIMAAAAAGLQLGAFAVVVETFLSRVSALPFATFLLLMQPIHLAIGLVEGVATACVVSFVAKARPDILRPGLQRPSAGPIPRRAVVLAFLAGALAVGGIGSHFASDKPDGLEWAIGKIIGKGEPKGAEESVHRALSAAQTKTALLPGYAFPKRSGESRGPVEGKGAGTGVAGVVGALLTLAISCGFALLVRRLRRPA